MMDRISGAVMSLAVAVFGMVSPLSAQAENLARYSLDGGATWTEAATMDDALLVVNAQDNDAIVEAMADQNFFVYPSDLFWHGMTLNCNLTLRSSPNSAAACKITRGTTDGNNTWKISGGKTMTVANIVVDAGSGLANGLFSIASDGALNLEEGALITTSAESNPGNAVKVSGTLRFNGGVVRGWAVSGAPVVYGASTGRIYLSAGGVENCSTTGSGVMVASAIGSGSNGFSGITDPVFVMTGGFIRNNVCADTGSGYKAALAFRENVVIEITGGEITGNTGASETAFGVILGQNSKLNIGGSAVISGNTVVSGSAANVGCVQIGGNIFEVIQVSNLTSDADIGVWSNNFTENSVFGKLATAGFTGAEYIHNDRDAALVGSADDTNLKWTSGGEPPVDPEEPLPVYTLTIPAQTGLELGADAVTTNDVPVAGVEGVYSIVSNTEVTINFKAASGYQIVSGNPVVVTVEADTVLDSAQYPIVEKRDIPTVTYGWKAEHLGTSETAIYTVGTKKYAYCSTQFGSLTVNAVPFDQKSDFPSGMSISVTGGEFFRCIDAISLPSGVDPSSAYGKLLTSGFWGPNSSGNTDVQITFNNLESGKDYLVQFISHSTLSGRNGQISVGGKTIDPAWDFGGSLVGVFKAEGASQSFTFTFAGKSFVSGFQVRELAEGEGAGIIDDDPVPPEEPLPVYTLTIPAQTGLELGADAVTTNDVPVAGVAGVYSIVSNTEVTINFKAASGYQIVSGNPVVVTVEANMTLDQFPTVKKQGGEYELGWTAGPMAADGSTIRKDGTLVYAYNAANAKLEINEVQFAKGYNWPQTADIKCDVAPTSGKTMLDAGLSGNMASLMREAWTWTVDGDTFAVTLTLKGLTSGKTYLCQLVSHSHWAPNMKISANGSPAHTIGDDTYGASIVGIFKATGETETVTVTYTNSSGDRPLNAIQVRELPVKKGPTIIYW